MILKKIGNLSQYFFIDGRFRPLVVTSKVIKFIEGFIIPKLKGYCYRKMNRAQYGFMKDVGI